MSRELKRVPLDFDWPLDRIWPGYTYSVPERHTENCGCPEPWTEGGMCAWHKTEWHDESSRKLEPPEGEGWQAWETVSEGSPISPVFATPEGLVAWAVGFEGKLGVGGSPVSRVAAEEFVKAGWAPTLVRRAGVVRGGVEDLAVPS